MQLKKIVFTAALLSAGLAQAFTPQGGIWSVASERNGKPGRGFNIDVQNTTLVMQVYGYERNGSPTFYLTSGPFADNRYTGTLMQYRGGRYFGSGDISATETGSAGTVSLRFVSGTRGYVTFPGEGEKEIARFNFSYSDNPESLRSLWLLTSMTNSGPQSDLVNLSELIPGTVNGTGMAATRDFRFGCEHMVRGPNAGYVVCVKLNASGSTVLRNYRFNYSVNDGEGTSGVFADASSDLLVVRRMTNAKGDGTGIVIKSEPQAGTPEDLARLQQHLTEQSEAVFEDGQ